MIKYTAKMNDPVTPFNRRLVRLRRDRAAAGFAGYDFLLRHAAGELAERLADVKRVFKRVLILGCHTGQVAEIFVKPPDLLVQADFSYSMARQVPGAVVVDEEFLPFAPGSFDLVIAPLTLHWVGDLPGTLLQIRNVLQPDGLFLGTMLGGETLVELRGVLPGRVSPFADLRDMGMLMQRAGFALPVVDGDKITVTYKDIFALLRDLRGMGATHAPNGTARPLSRATLFRAAELYSQFQDNDGKIPATFQMIHIAGWSPHATQQQALRPGSAKVRLADVLGVSEIGLET